VGTVSQIRPQPGVLNVPPWHDMAISPDILD
jgi:hypothetical protein